MAHAEGVAHGAGVELQAGEVEEHEGGEDVLVEGGVVEEAQVRGELREGQPVGVDFVCGWERVACVRESPPAWNFAPSPPKEEEEDPTLHTQTHM